jgi:hypothetical protein
MPQGHYVHKGHTTPYITKNPAYDSFHCECGSVLRDKSPMRIEQHRKTLTHKNIMSLRNNRDAEISRRS